jgi:hypothetical protein
MKRKPEGSATWPTFDSPLLQGIAAEFLRRRKALRVRAGLACQREFSETAAGSIERLNLEFPIARLRLSVWADGCMWLSVCVPAAGRNAGWAFRDTFHGDVQDVTGATLVGMVESTIAISFGVDPATEREQLRKIWERVRPYAG